MLPLLFLAVLITVIQSYGQRITMKIPSFPATANGLNVLSVNVQTKTPYVSNLQSGTPVMNAITVTKENGADINDLFRASLTAQRIPEVRFDYYNAANTLYFTISLNNVAVETFNLMNEDCKTPSCLTLLEQIAFQPEIIKMTESPSGKIVSWNNTLKKAQ